VPQTDSSQKDSTSLLRYLPNSFLLTSYRRHGFLICHRLASSSLSVFINYPGAPTTVPLLVNPSATDMIDVMVKCAVHPIIPSTVFSPGSPSKIACPNLPAVARRKIRSNQPAYPYPDSFHVLCPLCSRGPTDASPSTPLLLGFAPSCFTRSNLSLSAFSVLLAILYPLLFGGCFFWLQDPHGD